MWFPPRADENDHPFWCMAFARFARHVVCPGAKRGIHLPGPAGSAKPSGERLLRPAILLDGFGRRRETDWRRAYQCVRCSHGRFVHRNPGFWGGGLRRLRAVATGGSPNERQPRSVHATGWDRGGGRAEAAGCPVGRPGRPYPPLTPNRCQGHPGGKAVVRLGASQTSEYGGRNLRMMWMP